MPNETVLEPEHRQRLLQQRLKGLGRIYERLLELKEERPLFIVGGAVRDILLGREPADFDFAVAGSGVAFAREFSRRIRGKLVILSEPDDEARVVYRKKITFDFNGLGTGTIADDLRRRDFTINAIASALPEVDSLIDPYGGQADLRNKIIRPVASDSLALDPLRLLRAFRLGLELGFVVHPSLYEQAKPLTLRHIAAERIGTELLRILEAPGSFSFIEKLYRLNHLADIFPELAPLLADEELRSHTFRAVYKLEELLTEPGFFSQFQPEWQNYFDLFPYRRALLKLALLVHDIAKPHTRFINEAGEVHFYGHDHLGAKLAAKIGYERLRLSREQVRMLSQLVKEHMRLHLLATAPELSDRAIRRYFRDLGEQAFGSMLLCYADGWATAGRTIHLEETISRMIEQQRREAAKTKIKRLVTGDDLVALGMKPGPAFRVILEELEHLQIEGKITTKEEGLIYLKNYLAQEAKWQNQ